MGIGKGRRRATGIRSSVALPGRQGLLRGLAVASIVGVGAVTGFGVAGMGPLAALAGDAEPTETSEPAQSPEPAETEPATLAPSDGGGAPTPSEEPSEEPSESHAERVRGPH